MILMIVGMMNFLLGAQFLEESVIWDETVLVLLWCKLRGAILTCSFSMGSPRAVRMYSSSANIMVPSSCLSYNFIHSTKSSYDPLFFSFLIVWYMGMKSPILMNFSPFFSGMPNWPTDFSEGFRSTARRRSPM